MEGRSRAQWSAEKAQGFSRMLRTRMEGLLEDARKGGQYRDMLQQRQSLPIWAMKDEIVQLVENNQVIVLSGETGSGKSTQVPQFLLDHYIDSDRGSAINIICTQPRRISATGLADRVSAERCEKVGETVGYSIRLESRLSEKTCLTFVTTGVLLRRLQDDARLDTVSHVIVDEGSYISMCIVACIYLLLDLTSTRLHTLTHTHYSART